MKRKDNGYKAKGARQQREGEIHIKLIHITPIPTHAHIFVSTHYKTTQTALLTLAPPPPLKNKIPMTADDAQPLVHAHTHTTSFKLVYI